MNEYLDLFLTFAKIGAMMFGGGYAMLPMLTREIIDKKTWATESEILDYFAISQCTPGIIAVNTATFVGHKRKGLLGGIAATVGVVTVPVIVILIIAAILKNYWQLPAVAHAFRGIRVAVTALIFNSVLGLIKKNVRGWQAVLLCAAGFITVAFLKWTPIVAVVFAAFCGLLMKGRKAE